MSRTATIYKNRAGFTLIELSLVLVIIGLVIGGVLVGQDLIKQASARKNISELQQLQLALKTFQLKYGCIAGDCVNATDLFGNYIPVTASCTMPNGNGNGNGNNLIDDGGTGSWFCESRQSIYSLVAASFLPKSRVTPCHTSSSYFKGVNDSCAYFYVDDVYSAITPRKNKNTISWAKYAISWVQAPALSPNEAQAIDIKIDDGIPNKGKFFGLDAAPVDGGAIVVGSCFASGVYNNSDALSCRSVYYLD